MIKLYNGVYELGEFFPFEIKAKDNGQFPRGTDFPIYDDLCSLANKLTTTLAEPTGWSGDSGPSHWHIDCDGHAEFTYKCRPNFMLICALCNDHRLGTQIRHGNNRITSLLPWHIYLVKLNKWHRSPFNTSGEWRIFYRFYLRIENDLP